MLRMLILSTILVLTLTSTVSASENMTLEGMTGGISTDAKGLLFEVMQWVTAIALIGCAVRAISGHITGHPGHTKQGINGLVYIVIVIIIYYAATSGIAYVKTLYG